METCISKFNWITWISVFIDFGVTVYATWP